MMKILVVSSKLPLEYSGSSNKIFETYKHNFQKIIQNLSSEKKSLHSK
jgi:hypothetical protein